MRTVQFGADVHAKIQPTHRRERPFRHGHDAVKALQAMVAGDAKALICLGGNFAVAMPE
jgi:anaerobic selenocysteine-containing dehydrogenase